MTKLKILYLTNVPAPYRVDFFNELGLHSDLTVLFERKTSSSRNASWHDYEFKNFEAKFSRGINLDSDKALSLSTIKYIRDKSYDFIIVGGYATPTSMLSILYMNFKKIKFVLNVDGGMIPSSEKKIIKKIKKYFIGSARYWLSTSEKTTKYLTYYGANHNNIYKYPFTSILEKDVLKKPLTLAEKKNNKLKLNIKYDKMIVAVGSFNYLKGFDLLIKATKGIPSNWGVYIIGGIPTVKYLEMIESLNLKNIHFIDFLDKKDLISFYRASDLFVLPTRNDVWGLVINEAISNGLPVISTFKSGAAIELIEDDHNGFVIQEDNHILLGNKIFKILSDDEISKKMGMNSLEISRNYTIEKMVNEHLSILQNI